MAHERMVAVLGAAAVVAGFSQRVGARGPVEVGATAYGGGENIHYSSCDGGTTMGARYGGVGLQAKLLPGARLRGSTGNLEHPVTESEARRGEGPADIPDTFLPPYGLSASVAVASEVERVDTCSGCSARFSQAIPKAFSRSAARLHLDYDWRYFGIRAGATAYQVINRAAPEVSTVGFPEFMMRAGPTDIAWFELGVGSYNIPTLLRPGLYIGAGGAPRPGWSVVGHIASQNPGGSGDPVLRFDLELGAPVNPWLKLGAGAAIFGSGAMRFPEARLFAVTEL